MGTRFGSRWPTSWGSTAAERAAEMAGDEFLAAGPQHRTAMTRAISIQAPPERVWLWLAQLGRGAGFYSVDWLDNGGRSSARHPVSWIPELRLGDATAIGYLRHLQLGESLAWWVDGVSFAGAECRLVSSYLLSADGPSSRLVSRMSADARGATASLAILVFKIIDSVMATRQLYGLRRRIEDFEGHPEEIVDPETTDRAQYQLYEALYAAGGGAGVPGKEHAARWRRSAIEDGILPKE